MTRLPESSGDVQGEQSLGAGARHAVAKGLWPGLAALSVVLSQACAPAVETPGSPGAPLVASARPTTTKAGAALSFGRTTRPVTHVAVAAIGASRFALGYLEEGAQDDTPPMVWFAASTGDGSQVAAAVPVGRIEKGAHAGGELLLDINAPLEPGSSSAPADALASAIVMRWTTADGASMAWRSIDGGRSFARVARAHGTQLKWRVTASSDGAEEPSAVPPGDDTPLAAQRLSRPSPDARLLAVGLDAHGALFGTWHEPSRDRLSVHRYGYDWTGMSNRAEMFDIPVTVLTERASGVAAAAGTPYRDGALVVWARRDAAGTALEGRLVSLDLLCVPPRPSAAAEVAAPEPTRRVTAPVGATDRPLD